MKRHYNQGQQNPNWGKFPSSETRAKTGMQNRGEQNGQWKGDDVGYTALHQWVHSRLPKPEVCESCRTRPPIDLASKANEYKRDLDNWWWICRRCHMKLDGRLVKLHNQNIRGWLRECNFCGGKYWVIPCVWNNGQGRFCSKRCSNKGRYLPVGVGAS